ncbi:MAG: peptidase U32 family protein [Bacteroidales bacterium]
MKKPELLLPAGHPEAFYAALEGGADAVYLGMKSFNARERAFNFNNNQLGEVIRKAHEQHVKVYITLNTLIKTKELPELIHNLHILETLQPDAVIIQDWGVYHLIKKHFPTLTIHGSTQMGNHNSLGAEFSGKKGFERIIMARELTMNELDKIAQRSPIDIEVFVHGALCYSFSGMCLFSSFLGGQSANRGLCKQPCRRMYSTEKGKDFIFNLKDNQQIETVEKFKQLGIASLKVEGRLKSAEYVYTVAKAYRLALDNPEKTGEAKAMLEQDLGREKTGYFLQGNIKNSISSDTYSGMLLGKIQAKTAETITFSSPVAIEIANRLRVRPQKAQEGAAFKVKQVEKIDQNTYTVKGKIPGNAQINDQVYLTDYRTKKFPSSLETETIKLPDNLSAKRKQKIINSVRAAKMLPKTKKDEIFVRVNSINWMKKLYLPDISGVFLNLSRSEWKEFRPDVKFLQKNREKVIIELPRFIPEEAIGFYHSLVENLYKNGYYRFSLSHLSQKEFFSDKADLITNENVYTLNDAAVNLLKQEGIQHFITPLENELENLNTMHYKDGIVPVYFHPAVFYSRMPVNVNDITSDKNEQFHRTSIDGITHIYPAEPVSLTQYADKLRSAGFHRFLIDLSYEKPSGNRLATLIKRLHKSVQVQPSSNFNFVKGLE